jgi:hypothetical protein
MNLEKRPHARHRVAPCCSCMRPERKTGAHYLCTRPQKMKRSPPLCIIFGPCALLLANRRETINSGVNCFLFNCRAICQNYTCAPLLVNTRTPADAADENLTRAAITRSVFRRDVGINEGWKTTLSHALIARSAQGTLIQVPACIQCSDVNALTGNQL